MKSAVSKRHSPPAQGRGTEHDTLGWSGRRPEGQPDPSGVRRVRGRVHRSFRDRSCAAPSPRRASAPRQVTHLILTGGHSRWYFVDAALRGLPAPLDANRTVLRHKKPEQSVARGLAFDPMMRSNAGGPWHPSGARRTPCGCPSRTGRCSARTAPSPPGMGGAGAVDPAGASSSHSRRGRRCASGSSSLPGREGGERQHQFSGQRRAPLADGWRGSSGAGWSRSRRRFAGAAVDARR